MGKEGRIALVTGAGRGIGAATAKELAVSGMKIAINYFSDYISAERVVHEKAISMHTSERSGFITGSYVPVNGGKDML